MNYNPSDEADEVGAVGLVEPFGYPSGFYWIRLEDTATGGVEDIPIEGADVVYWWTHGVGRCDCVRWRAFTQIRQQSRPDIACASRPGNRMRLHGIWNRGGEQIYPGEPHPNEG